MLEIVFLGKPLQDLKLSKEDEIGFELNLSRLETVLCIVLRRILRLQHMSCSKWKSTNRLKRKLNENQV